MNDRTIFVHGPLYHSMLNGTFPEVPFILNGKQYRRPIILGDGIYPELSLIWKANKLALEEKELNASSFQESWRKDIECTFGNFKKGFLYLDKLMMSNKTEVCNSVSTCIALYNYRLEGIQIYSEPSHNTPMVHEELHNPENHVQLP